MRFALLCLLTLIFSLSLQAQPASYQNLKIKVRDQADTPLAKARVAASANGTVLRSATTNAQGEATISLPATPYVDLSVSKDGFETITQKHLVLTEAGLEVEITLPAKIEAKTEVTVHAGDAPTVSTTQEMERADLKNLPNRPATVKDSLAYTPAVLQSSEGVVIAGGDEKHNALVVNSVDATDPATGQFGLLVPVDAVETLSVAATPFQAQYGNFTSGVVSADTRRGGEKWNFELNDPLPEFRIRSGHLQGLRSATPNFSVGGPVVAQKFYFSQTAQVYFEKSPTLTLPFPFNETRKVSGNFFSQGDLVISSTHTLTGTFHVTPQDTRFANLDFFNPQPVTPNTNGNATAVSLMDRLTVRGGLLQSTLARQAFRIDVTPQGPADMVLTPEGNHGNYFADQSRDSGRLAWLETYSMNPRKLAGVHTLQFGTSATFTEDEGTFTARPVEVQSVSGTLLKRIQFAGGGPFHKSDFETAVFAQDHWEALSNLAFDGGVRMDYQQITDTVRYAPRAGFSWRPFGKSSSTILRGGGGVFFDHVPLNVYAFQNYPQQVITTFDQQGNLVDGPRTFKNVIDLSGSHLWLVARGKARNDPGSFAPYSVATSAELDQRLNSLLHFQVKYSYRDAHGLVTISPRSVLTGATQDALVMRDNGSSRYRDVQFTAKVREDKKRKVFFSYVRSSSHGSADALNAYVGDFAFPVVRRSFFTSTNSDSPNRILVWGETPLKWKMKVLPFVEYRTGFPYSQTDAFQNFVGLPNSNRFPGYFSLDATVTKDFQITPKYAGRISVRALNLTDHFNALAVHANSADRQFGSFFGSYGRRFRLDFDVLF